MAGAKTRQRVEWSPREREVLDLIAAGRTNGQIAEDLGISFATAKWHVSELISKVGVSSREEVAAYWRHEQRFVGRISRVLRSFMPSALVLKFAMGGVLAGSGAVSLVWIAVATRADAPGQGTAMPPVQAAAPTPTPWIQRDPVTGCATIGRGRTPQEASEGLWCPALNYPQIAALDNGNCDLSGADIAALGLGHLDHVDFRGCTLDGANLGGMSLANSNFENVSARNALLAGSLGMANLKGADFSGADLTRANFQGSDLTNTNLLGADLTNAITRGARWKNTTCPDGTNSDENEGTCVGTLSVSDYWPSAKDGGWTPPICRPQGTPPPGLLCAADLYAGIRVDGSGHCEVESGATVGPDLRWADLRGCDLSGAVLAGVDFEDASLVGADLSGADLRGAKFFKTDLSGADLRGARLDGAVISHSNLTGADLTGASVGGALLRGDYAGTTCPDGTSSDADDGDGFTCSNNLGPAGS